MKTSERFALNEWLTDYPASFDYDDVLDALRDGNENVMPWAWFENMITSELIENIDNTRAHFAAVTKEQP